MRIDELMIWRGKFCELLLPPVDQWKSIIVLSRKDENSGLSKFFQILDILDAIEGDVQAMISMLKVFTHKKHSKT